MEKKISIIDDIRSRYANRNKERLDAEGESEERRSEKNHGNTKLPYGIAKGKGIDTTGLSPKEVWEKLIGEGVSPKKEYEKLSKEKSTSAKSKIKPGSTTMNSKETAKNINDFPNGTKISGGNIKMEKISDNKWTGEIYGAPFDNVDDSFMKSIVKGSVHSEFGIEIPEVKTENTRKKEPEVLNLMSGDMSVKDISDMEVGTKMESGPNSYEKVGPDNWKVTTKYGEVFEEIWDNTVYGILSPNVKVYKKASNENEPETEKSKNEPKDKSAKKETGLKDKEPNVSQDLIELRKQFKNAKTYESPQEADDALRAGVGAVWGELSIDQKEKISEYTGSSYRGINKSLTGQSNKFQYYGKNIEEMTNMIDKTALSEDTILYRGVGYGGFSSMFKLDEGKLDGMDAAGLVGLIGRNDGFSSCGTVQGKGFTHKPVQMRILCPKGTKAAYAEPWSVCGKGDGKEWDGKSKQSYFSDEDETILQRGTSFKIIKAEKHGDSFYLDVAVTGQNAIPIDDLKKMYGW